MNDLISLTQHWAKKQLDYPSPRPYRENFPRNTAVQALIHSTLAQGLVVSLPPTTAASLLHRVSERIEAAQAVWNDDEFLEYSLVEQSLERLSKAFAYLGDYTSALGVAQRKLNDFDRASVVADLAVTAFKSGHTETAISLQAEALTLAGKIENQYVRAHAYAELLPRMIRLDNVDRAVEIALLIVSQGSTEREHLHTLIYDLCSQQRFNESERVARHLQSPLEKGIAFCEISTALADIDKVHSQALMVEAEEIALSEISKNAQIRLYSALIVSCFYLGDQERFERFHAMASELVDGFEVDGYPSPLSDYVIALAKIGRVKDAHHVANTHISEIPGKKFIHWAIMEHNLAEYLLRSQQYEDAYTTARQLREPGEGMGSDLHWGTRILIRLVLKLTADAEFEECQKNINQVVDQARHADPVNLQIFLHYAITRILARYQRFEAMFELLDRAGIDEFAQAIASAAEEFEVIEKGLSLQILQEIIRIGSQKYDDYAELLKFVDE